MEYDILGYPRKVKLVIIFLNKTQIQAEKRVNFFLLSLAVPQFETFTILIETPKIIFKDSKLKKNFFWKKRN